MKTALTAIAVIASATVALADDNGFTVIDKEAVGNGQFQIVTQSGGDFTLTQVNCVPMQSAVLDVDDSPSDLDDDGAFQLVQVERGTVEHDIAAAACS